MQSIVDIGTEVIIFEDTRPGKPAIGKTGKVVGFLDNVKVAVFFQENGTVIDNEQELLEVEEQMDGCCGEEPKGIVVYWDPDTQEFPKKKCYLAVPHLIYELEDGTRVNSTCVYGVLSDRLAVENLFKKIEIMFRKTGRPEKELNDLLVQWRQFLDAGGNLFSPNMTIQ